MAGLNPIACEPCRSKKCKCDRKLPTCSQCNSSPSACRYQEGGKRGLPAAYMNGLEARLHETENALHAALLALQDLGSIDSLDINASSPASRSERIRSKAEKQDEWKQLPLKTSQDLVAWLQQMSHGLGSNRWHSAQQISEAASPPIPPPDLGQPEPFRRHQPSSNFTDVLERLRMCDPPLCPNSFDEHFPSRWPENYF